MKRMFALTLALACLFSLTGCHSREELRTMRQQLDYANGTAQPELPDVLETSDGTTLEEQTVYASGGVTVTALGIYDSEDYYYIPFSLRNDSAEQLRYYLESDMTVNGWSTYGFMNDAEDIIPGGVDYDTLRIRKAELTQVVHPGQISGTFVIDMDSWEDIPFTLTTSAGAGEDKPFAYEVPVWSDSALTVALVEMENNYHSLTFTFCAENSDRYSCQISIDSVAVNGKGEDELFTWYGATVPAGGKRCFEMDLSWYELEDAGISPDETLEALDLTLELEGGEDYATREVPVHIDLSQLGS